MDYNPPYGSVDPNAPYNDEVPEEGIEGSIVPAKAIEDPQREIVAVIAAAGIDRDAGDLTQLSQAIAAMIAAGVPADVLRRTQNTGNLAAGFYVTPEVLEIVGGIVTPVFVGRNVMTLDVASAFTLANPEVIPTGGRALIICTNGATGYALTLGSAYRVAGGEWAAEPAAINFIDLTFGGPGGLIDVDISQRGSV